MKPVCYLALVSSDEAAHLALMHATASFPRCVTSVMMAGDSRLTLLIDEGTEVRRFEDDQGLVVGPLFSRRTSRAPDADTKIPISVSRGRDRALFRDYWGGYIAFFVDPVMHGWTVLRAPLGMTPCYYVVRPGLFAFASHVDLLVTAGLLDPEIDRGFIVEHLLHAEVRGVRTGLEGVSELPGGVALTVGPADHQTAMLWSPWSFVASQPRKVDPDAAAQRIRKAVLASTNAWAAASGPVLLTLSGGLDSSIVAACLARSGARFTCLTLRTEDLAGDEESYAAAMTAKIGASLLSRRFTLDDVDVTRSDAAHLPRPLARSFLQGLDRACQRVADEVGATAIFNGAGGDNVFCLLHSAAPLADRLLAGDTFGAWRTLNDICRLTDSDYGAVIRRAIAKLSPRKRAYRWTIEREYLNREILASLDVDHPWLAPPPGTLPGEAAHVALLLAIQNHLEGFITELTMPHVSPLLSQPVVEACLAVPSWLWCRGGINRVIARDAFRDYLPPEVLHRRSKGTPDGFCARIFEVQRQQIRELLGDGLLAGWEIIDREAVLRKIDAGGPLRGLDHLRILTLADVEAWARTWVAARARRSQ